MADQNSTNELFPGNEKPYFTGNKWFEKNILAQVEKQCVPRKAGNLVAIISGFLLMIVILVVVSIAFNRSYKLGSYSFITNPFQNNSGVIFKKP